MRMWKQLNEIVCHFAVVSIDKQIAGRRQHNEAISRTYRIHSFSFHLLAMRQKASPNNILFESEKKNNNIEMTKPIFKMIVHDIVVIASYNSFLLFRIIVITHFIWPHLSNNDDGDKMHSLHFLFLFSSFFSESASRPSVEMKETGELIESLHKRKMQFTFLL